MHYNSYCALAMQIYDFGYLHENLVLLILLKSVSTKLKASRGKSGGKCTEDKTGDWNQA